MNDEQENNSQMTARDMLSSPGLIKSRQTMEELSLMLLLTPIHASENMTNERNLFWEEETKLLAKV